MQIQEIKLDNLREYENNPRNNENAVEFVAESIKKFGFKVPIIIDKNNTIIAGHTRAAAARFLGLAAIPCIVADDLTPEQIKAFRLADNKTGELSTWDLEKLEKELEELTAFDVDMSLFGFDESIFDADFSTEFELSNSDKPISRTITLSLCEEQYIICESIIDYFKGKELLHTYGNANERSNYIFEGLFEWAEQKNLL